MRGEALSALCGSLQAGFFEPVAKHEVSAFGQDRFGVELHVCMGPRGGAGP